MSTDFCLTDEELVSLTRKLRPTAQCRALNKMGVEHRRRPDGSVVVHRSHVEGLLGATNRSNMLRKEYVIKD